MIFEVEVKNWEKFNARSDVKACTWFRMSNDFFADADFYGVSATTRMVWVYFLCASSKKGKSVVKVNSQMILDAMKISDKDLVFALEELQNIGCLKTSGFNAISIRSNPDVRKIFPSATDRQTDEQTDNTSPATIAVGFFEKDERLELEEVSADELAIKVLTALNSICFKNFMPVKSNQKFINARIDEKYTYEDFVSVITHRNQLWSQSDKMAEFLRPKTLFNSENFDGYLQAAKNANKPKIDPLDALFEQYTQPENQGCA
jgi:uncharacterized phage protein (TIGR02220 family)